MFPDQMTQTSRKTIQWKVVVVVVVIIVVVFFFSAKVAQYVTDRGRDKL